MITSLFATNTVIVIIPIVHPLKIFIYGIISIEYFEDLQKWC